MFKYKTIVLHLTSLIEFCTYEEIEDLLSELNKLNYKICAITKHSIIENEFKEFVSSFSLIKTYKQELDYEFLIKQILGEMETTSALVIGNSEKIYSAANETSCLSIGSNFSGVSRPDFSVERSKNILNIINKINVMYSNISSHIRSKKNINEPLLVGINGVDTSGKTALSTELSVFLEKQGIPTQVIRIDDFHNESKIRYSEQDEIRSYYNHAFDLEKLESDLLLPIRKNKEFYGEIVHLDIETDSYSKNKMYNIDKSTVVIIEGVLLYREPINKYFDIRLYIDITFEEVIKRAQIRDYHMFGDNLLNKYQNKYIPVQKSYIEKVNPRNICDIHINNEDYYNPVILKNDYKVKEESEILLCPVEEKHLPELHDIQSDHKAITMLGVIGPPKMSDYESAKAYVVYNKNSEIVGQVELFNISWRNRRAELSIAIKKAHRGKGYGEESIQRILKYGFDVLGLYRIWLRVLEINEPAIKLYEKMGFTREGVCRSESLRNGKYLSQIQMSILLPEWVGK